MSPDALRHIIARHGGNRSAISRAEGMSLSAIRRLITAADLTIYADSLAASLHRPGPRDSTSEETMACERDAILEALTRNNVTKAAAEMGMGAASLYRRIKRYEITDDEIAAYATHCTSGPGRTST